MLTRQHYKAIAGIIKSTKDKFDLIKALGEYFKMDNPNFQVSRFEQACEGELEQVKSKDKQLEFEFMKV